MSYTTLISSKVASLRNRTGDLFIERRLNIQTTGRKDVRINDSVPYSTFAYWSIERVLNRMELSDDDVFVDFGCGKGRVVCAAATRRIRKAIGVDIDQQLCERARANASRMRRRLSPIEIIASPAQDFDSSECTAMFFFNPFGPGTLHAVLKRILESSQVHGRPIRLAYVNPRHDLTIAQMGAFERYDFWPCPRHGRLKFDVSFWRIRG